MRLLKCENKYSNVTHQNIYIQMDSYKTGDVHGYIQALKTSIHIYNKMNTVHNQRKLHIPSKVISHLNKLKKKVNIL